MASEKSNRGGLPAFIIGGILIVALVGAPLYLPAVQSDDERLRAAIEPDLAKVAARLAAVNGNVAVIAELRKQLEGEKVKLSLEDVVGRVEKSSKSLDDVDKQLAETNRLLTGVQNKYKDLLSDPIPVAPRGASLASDSFRKLKELTAAQETQLREADSIVKQMQGLTFGGASGRSNMAVNRLAASVAYQQALLASNRAELLRSQAASDRIVAAALLDINAEARRSAASVKARVPADLIATLQKRAEELPKAIEQGETFFKQLDQIVAKQEEKAKQLREQARKARAELAQLDLALSQGGNTAVSTYRNSRERYEQLSIQARQAEAAADAIENGWLQGATLNDAAADDLLAAPYEGGQAVPGLVTLRVRRDGAERDLDSLKKALETTQKQIEDAESQSKQMDEQLGEMTKLADACVKSVDKLCERAEGLSKDARAAEDLALAALDNAARFANQATTAAQTRVREARAEAGKAPPDKPNERLKEIADDKDGEAATRFLSAQAAFAAADVLCERIGDMRMSALLAGLRADEKGKEAGAKDDAGLAKARERGIAYAKKATEELAAAATLVEGANYSIEGKRVTGRDYVWQFQSAQAAAHLMLRQLTDKKDEQTAQRDKAYELLTKAAKGREASPLVSPAVDMILYLQKSAGAK